VAEAEAREDARAELIEEHVVRCDEALHGGAALGLLEVEDGAALAAVQELEGDRLARDLRRHVAEVVAAVGVLDLVDGRAEIREDEGREGAGEKPREIEDAGA
jgi:hypothetical protein